MQCQDSEELKWGEPRATSGGESSVRRLVFSLYLPEFVLSLGMTVAIPLIPLYAKTFDVSLGTATLVASAIGFGAILSDVPVGMLCDRWGRRPVMLAGAVLASAGALLAGLAQGFVDLIVYAGVLGVGTSMWEGSRQIIAADAVPPSARGRVMSGFMMVGTVGNSIGPVVGGFAASVGGLRVPFLLFSALCLCVFALSLLLVGETRPATRVRETSSIRTSTVRLEVSAKLALGYASVVNRIRVVAKITLIPLFGVIELHAGLTEAGAVLSVAAVANLFFALPGGMIADKYGRKSAFIPGIIATGLSYSVFYWVGDLRTALLVSAVMGLGTGIGAGAMGSLTADLSPDASRGVFMGTWKLLGDIGRTLTPLFAGLIIDAYGVRAAFAATGLLIMSASIPIALFIGETRGGGGEVQRASNRS